ncbi:peroxisome biogenesis factor 2 [Anoplophora glabripennis]|uniref:peroxisome biogenesis factor 2 n=1 Tax=Anoplophora glabripennis TaxID=217634 RepID=UPI000873DF2D|nr:peroxisome biogenesis factor 2 [Anoplophora glabripennis]
MKNNLLRVTQMNAVYLDEEIYKAFRLLLDQATRYLPPGLTAPYESEINLFLRLAIIKYSIFSNCNTFGQQLLSIKYENLSYTKKVLYMIGCCLDYIKVKLELWKPSHEINNTISNIYTFIKLFDFINLSVFLRNGVKPLLIERILGLTQVYVSDIGQRQYESKYLARELLWNSFIEILVYILPLINYHKMKRTLRNYNLLRRKPIYTVMSNRVITMHSKCAYCGENPILPHHMGCAHIFCYVCLTGNQTADSRYECPLCEHRNPNILCDRVAVL